MHGFKKGLIFDYDRQKTSNFENFGTPIYYKLHDRPVYHIDQSWLRDRIFSGSRLPNFLF